VKQLLQAFPSEPVNERRVRNKSRRSQLRQVVAAKPERDLKVRPKLSELQLKERPRARKQRDQLGSAHEVAKPRVRRSDRKNSQFGLTDSVHYCKPARHMSAGLFCAPNGNYVVLLSTAAVSAGRYLTPSSHTSPEAKIIADTNRNATCIFACPPM